MRTKREIKERLAKILKDKRLSYPSATVFNNAPLALIQESLETERDTLEWVLEE